MEAKNNTDNRSLFFFKFVSFVLFCTTVLLIVSLYDADNTNEVLQNKITSLERNDSIYSRLLESDSIVSYRVRNGEIVTYKQLAEENARLSSDYENCKIKLALIEKNYPIKTVRRGDVISVESAKIDSALLLLDVYRDKVTYDSREKTWTVVR